MSKQKDGRSGSNRQSRQDTVAEPAYISGKLVIITIAVLALSAAGFSWWFRYSSTTRAAKFWGPQGVELIREPDTVHLIVLEPMSDSGHQHNPSDKFADHYHTPRGVWRVAERRDVTSAHGLVHLRNELLMDRSLREDWTGPSAADEWQIGLEFRSSPDGPPLVILFSADCRRMLRDPLSSTPSLAVPSPTFAEGLRLVFAEWRSEPAANGAK